MNWKSHYSSSLWSFLPLLVLYIFIVIIFSSETIVGDETRHLAYATNLSQGFYTNSENPELANGPGYPLVLTIYTLVKAPYLIMRFTNAIFLILAVGFFFKSLLFFLGPKQSMLFSYMFGIYPPFLKWLTYLYSESFAILLACGFLYFFLRMHFSTAKRILNIVFAGSFLGALALTKVLFGYVILTALVFHLILFLFKRSQKIRASLQLLVIAFLYCIPFLGHTYSLTGKILYWGSGGGEILYWRSSPFPTEYGDWISTDVVLGKEEGDYFDTTSIFKNHGAFINSLEPFSIVQRDSLYKEKAINNIKKHPIKYLQNTAASGLRLFFNYPYSYTPQKTSSFVYILPNGVLLLFLLLAVYLFLKKPELIPFEIRFIALMASIFIGGLTLLDGRVRHLLPILPLLLFFILFVCTQSIRIKIN